VSTVRKLTSTRGGSALAAQTPAARLASVGARKRAPTTDSAGWQSRRGKAAAYSPVAPAAGARGSCGDTKYHLAELLEIIFRKVLAGAHFRDPRVEIGAHLPGG